MLSHEQFIDRLTQGGFATKSITVIGNVAAEGVEPRIQPRITNADALPTTIVVPYNSGFTFGASSEKELIGVKPELVAIVRLALKVSTQDFTVHDGIRSIAEQRHYVAIGTSQTMDSMHLPQRDGFGHATDLVPFIGGRPAWDWEGCYRVALAVDQAATDLGFAKNIRWGGAWDKRLSDFGGDVHAYKQEVINYQNRHPGKDFLDGPHFEWRD